MKNRCILTSIGTKESVFKDRETYPKDMCKDIEDLVSCNSARLAEGKGRGSLSIVTGDKSVKLFIEAGKSKLSKEDGIIVLLHCSKTNINTKCYYGKDTVVDFISESGNYGRDIDTIKEFCNSWKVSEGWMSSPILIIEDDKIFNVICNDSFFKEFIILKEY